MLNHFYLSHSGDGWQNLATDEWLLDHLAPNELILYCYVNRNAVIIGRNQNPWKECNLTAMEADGVQLVRRVTGGGAVYHDEGNLNFSFIAGEERYDVEKQLNTILQAVRSLGIPCEFTGRNDLLSDGRKFSGNAFCQRGAIRQHHGTLLIRSDMGRLQKYLQVDPRKLQAKGVASVRSRVCNLSEFREDLTVPMVLTALKRAFRRVYGDYLEWEPNDADRTAIATYAEKHGSWEWRLGATPQFDLELDRRFDWGGIQILLTSRDGLVEKADVFSDALDPELPPLVQGLLTGCRVSSADMAAALRRCDNGQVQDIAAWIEQERL